MDEDVLYVTPALAVLALECGLAALHAEEVFRDTVAGHPASYERGMLLKVVSVDYESGQVITVPHAPGTWAQDEWSSRDTTSSLITADFSEQWGNGEHDSWDWGTEEPTWWQPLPAPPAEGDETCSR